MTTTLCRLERVTGYNLIDRYKAFARYHFTLGNIAEDGHVFRKIKPPRRYNRPGSPPDYDTY